MPIYEYRCRVCGKKSTFLTLSVSAAYVPVCKHCGSPNVEKLVSRVAMFRSEESRLDDLGDPSQLAGIDENDPKSVARWMKKMGKDMGEDFEQEIEQAADEAESGSAGDESGPEVSGPGSGVGDDEDF